MKYNLIKMITNTQDQYIAEVVSTHETPKSAKVSYHQLLAALNNADDVKVAVVKIEDEYGNKLSGFEETIDNRPAPEPVE